MTTQIYALAAGIEKSKTLKLVEAVREINWWRWIENKSDKVIRLAAQNKKEMNSCDWLVCRLGIGVDRIYE